MVAVLNDYIDFEGTNHGIPNMPTDRHSPNGLARVTPKSNRGAASQEYDSWVMGNIGYREITSFFGIKDGAAGWTGGTYILFTDGTTDGYIWFRYNGAGSDPAPNINNFGLIDIYTADSSRTVTLNLHRLLLRLANTEVLMVGDDSINVRNVLVGTATQSSDGTLTDLVIQVDTLETGAAPIATPWDGTFTDPIDGAQDLAYADE